MRTAWTTGLVALGCNAVHSLDGYTDGKRDSGMSFGGGSGVSGSGGDGGGGMSGQAGAGGGGGDASFDAPLDATSPDADAGVDAGPSCSDGMKNGDETAVDCGGSCVPEKRCPINEACAIDDDCTTANCAAQTCATAPCPSSPPSNCECGTFEDHLYLFCTSHRSVSSASSTCAEEGMALVRIDSDAENEFVRMGGQASQSKWIGASDANSEGVWTWADGDTFWSGGMAQNGLFSRWGTAQPTVDPTLNCGSIAPGGTWSAADCDDNRHYVCERY